MNRTIASITLALSLLLHACGADAPTAQDLLEVDEATQCFAWPDEIGVKAKVLSTINPGLTWDQGTYEGYFMFANTTPDGQAHYSWQGGSEVLKANVHATTCTANHAAAGYNGWNCDGTYIACPFIDHSNPVKDVYFAPPVNSCKPFQNWAPTSEWQPSVTNHHGAGGVWCISAGTPGSWRYGIDPDQTKWVFGGWVLECSCAPPAGTVDITVP